MTKQNVERRDFKPIPVGKHRLIVKSEECIAASYSRGEAEKLKAKMEHRNRLNHKTCIKVWGYKHPKIVKFNASIMKCFISCLALKQ